MIDLNDVKITRGRRSSISVTVLRDGTLSVKAPYLVPKIFIRDFLERKKDWIEERQKIILKNKKEVKKFVEGEKFSYLGKEYGLELGSSYIKIELKGDKLLFPLALAKNGNIVMEKWYIKEAKKVISSLVDEYSEKMDTSYKGITYSDTRSQWGRCTHDNRLQFNWRLIMAPLLVVRYVVIHELSHTKEKNHSAKFWATVRTYNPSYKMQIKWLKTHGHGLIV